MHYVEIENSIISILERSALGVYADLGIPDSAAPASIRSELEIPKEKAHGDLASNIAMKASKKAGKDPLDLANLIKERMERVLASSELKDEIAKLEVRPPGFINFFLTKSHLHKTLLQIKREKENYGRSAVCRGLKVQVEFVSANPTGPLTIAHARQAAVGDALANIMEFVGCAVVREYYVNDEGTQMDILGNSIRARYLELFGMISEGFPEDGYKGAYVKEIAKAFKDKSARRYVEAKDVKPFREFGLNRIMDGIKKDLKDFGVKFDVWYSQKALARSGKVEKTINLLKSKGYIYEKDGAVWFRSTDFGDDKDRVVFKSDGAATYLAPDIAYHLDKYRRGFRRIIDIWGPDHHGYVPRMKAAVRALGYQEESLSVLIVQLATLTRGGKALSMSTRAGEFITLREVMDEVGKDVSRFCFLMRRLSSHLDFDLDAVKIESQENPVYYIQYAHARIWSILSYGKKVPASLANFDSGLLEKEEELELLRIMRRFPFVVNLSARSLEPCVILQYLQELAASFHSFYTKHRVVSEDINLTRARLVLVDCVRIVLGSALNLLGVSLPKKM